MRELCEILVVGFCLWLAWTALAPKPVFKIRFAKGALRVTRGKVTADFQQQIGEIFEHWQIRRGWIAAVQRGPQGRWFSPAACLPAAASSSAICGRTSEAQAPPTGAHCPRSTTRLFTVRNLETKCRPVWASM